MKATQPIRINAARIKSPPGGDWQSHDSVGQGRVQILPAGRNAEQQAMAVLTEIERLRSLGLDLGRTAVIARQWKYLDPLRAACEARGLPVSMADEEAPPLWRLRETQALLAFAEAHGALISSGILSGWLAARPANGWADSVQDALAAFADDTQGAEVTLDYFRDWLAEWGRANRHRQTGLLLLSPTAPRAWNSTMSSYSMANGRGKKARMPTPPAAFTTSQ